MPMCSTFFCPSLLNSGLHLHPQIPLLHTCLQVKFQNSKAKHDYPPQFSFCNLPILLSGDSSFQGALPEILDGPPLVISYILPPSTLCQFYLQVTFRNSESSHSLSLCHCLVALWPVWVIIIIICDWLAFNTGPCFKLKNSR